MAKYNSPLDAIIGLTEGATKQWTKQRKAEERQSRSAQSREQYLIPSTRITIREIAFEVMEDAYMKATGDGTLPANMRQIYYAARPEILEQTGRDELSSQYFLQALLPDYMDEYDCSDWNIVRDARGHHTEPHTGKVVPLGTLEVREYLGEETVLHGLSAVEPEKLFPTQGPENRYKNVLFIEKEGFDPLLEAAQISNRFDLGVQSTKGMSVTAVRELLDGLVERGVEKILVLHDFDITGFSIFGTLFTNSQKYRFRNNIPAVDIGLRLADAEDMDLQSEPFATKKDWDKVSRTLKRHGATPEEIDFLRGGKRVELNAMTSQQFIDFLERKLEEHGVEKLIPDDETLEAQARRWLGHRLMQAEMAKHRDRIAKKVAAFELPDDLRGLIQEKLDDDDAQPWDEAVATIVEELLYPRADEE